MSMNNDQKIILQKKIFEIIDRFKIKSILDIGSGQPALAVPISQKVERYTPVEADPDRVQILQEAGLNPLEGRFPGLDIVETYDLVLSSHSIPEEVEKYQSFLTKAWELVKPGGNLVIITFKGVEDDLVSLRGEMREKWIDNDTLKYQEMRKVLSTFGVVTEESVVSHSRTEDGSEMMSLLTLSIGGADDEKKSYREDLERILEDRYKVDGEYAFPHRHLVLLIRKD
jgi:2-polyprenyl-3-methyl-5-hydroxy-6-metoxy-1,4-benzoquinol methylase